MRISLFVLMVLVLLSSAYAEEPTYHAGYDETDYGKEGYSAGFDSNENTLKDAEGNPVPEGLQHVYDATHKDKETDAFSGYSETEKEDAGSDYGDTALRQYQDQKTKAALRMQGVSLTDKSSAGDNTDDTSASASTDFGKIISGESAQTSSVSAGNTGYYDTSGYYKPDNAGIFDAETSYLSESN